MKDSSSPSRPTSKEAENAATEIERRGFLQAVAASTLAAGTLSGCTVPVRSFRSADVAEFKVRFADYPELASDGGAVRVEHPRLTLYVIRESSQAIAVSAVCTHLGCMVARSGSGFRCPCHGSSFARDGSLRGGPARRGLEQFDAQLDSDGIFVKLSKTPREPSS